MAVNGPPNQLLAAARRRRRSPSGSGRDMSRQELADAVNAYLWTTYRERDNVDATYIGHLEQGRYRWPKAHRREAFRHVLQAATDADLGFWINRGTRSEPTSAAIPRRPSVGASARAATVGSEPPDHEDSDVGARGEWVDRRTLIRRTAAAGAGLAAVPAALLWAAAHDSAQAGKAAMPIALDPASVDDLRVELRRLADDYVHTSDLPRIVGDVIHLRDRISVHIDPRRPRPRQARELHLMMGATCLLLASISHDLGESDAAMLQARSAEVFADLAEHPDLAAWVLCTQAMIDLWRQRPADVLHHTERGEAMSISGSGGLRLKGLRVRALARLNRKEEARALLRQVEMPVGSPADGTGTLADLGAVFSFPETRRHYYAAVSHAELGNYPAVERAVAALGHDDRPPSSAGAWPISWALSRSYLALARLDHRGSDGGPEAAAAALQPVLGLAEPQRINQLGQVFDQIDQRLTASAYQNNGTVRHLREALHGFRPNNELAVTDR